MEVVQTKKSIERTVSSQGWISFRRYRLYVSTQLKKQKVEVLQFVTNLVVAYNGSAVVTYSYCEKTDETLGLSTEVPPIFHDHRQIPPSPPEMEEKMRYVVRRPPNRKRKRFPIDAVQLDFDSRIL